MNIGRLAGRLLLASCLAGLIAPAWALKFRLIRDGEVLLIYDCGNLPDESRDRCAKHETMFSGPMQYKDGSRYEGDAAIFEQLLRQRGSTWRQIWLYSGGGNLNEGVKLGELFRQHSQYVVVPDGASCVSACTVAFLGGRLREVQAGGSYKVHAYSGVMQMDLDDAKDYLGPDAEFALDSFVRREARGGREWAARLFGYAQRMIGGQFDGPAVARALDAQADFRQRYRESGAAQRDLEQIQKEGAVRAQEVLMRIEREAFEQSMQALRRQAGSLGPRAEHALDMLEIMFSSRIAGTFSLDPTTLKERGYVNVRR